MTASLPMDRSDLATPALILDRAAPDRKIEAMAAFARTYGIALRPHAKTNKSDGQVVLDRTRATFLHSIPGSPRRRSSDPNSGNGTYIITMPDRNHSAMNRQVTIPTQR